MSENIAKKKRLSTPVKAGLTGVYILLVLHVLVFAAWSALPYACTYFNVTCASLSFGATLLFYGLASLLVPAFFVGAWCLHGMAGLSWRVAYSIPIPSFLIVLLIMWALTPVWRLGGFVAGAILLITSTGLSFALLAWLSTVGRHRRFT